MKPNKQTTIQTLLALGKGQLEIARVTGIDRKTIGGYQRQFALANSSGVATGSPPAASAPAAPEVPSPRPPAQTSACEPWREFIEAQLKLKRKRAAIPPLKGLV